MALFIVFYSLGYIAAILWMMRLNKQAKEIIAFSALAAIGFVTWILVMIEHPVKPTQWISWVIEMTRL